MPVSLVPRISANFAGQLTDHGRSPRRQRRVRAGSLADDAAAVAGGEAAVDFYENRRQRPRLRRGKPQAEEVALALGLEPVLIGRAGVQDRVIVQELDVAWHESHVEPQRRIVRKLGK